VQPVIDLAVILYIHCDPLVPVFINNLCVFNNFKISFQKLTLFQLVPWWYSQSINNWSQQHYLLSWTVDPATVLFTAQNSQKDVYPSCYQSCKKLKWWQVTFTFTIMCISKWCTSQSFQTHWRSILFGPSSSMLLANMISLLGMIGFTHTGSSLILKMIQWSGLVILFQWSQARVHKASISRT
jgi:hypothetical protein